MGNALRGLSTAIIALIGVGISAGAGYILWWIFKLLIKGALEGNFIMLIGGGILLYFLFMLLLIAFFLGLWILIVAVGEL